MTFDQWYFRTFGMSINDAYRCSEAVRRSLNYYRLCWDAAQKAAKE